MIIRRYYFSDGWTDHDLVYRWKSEGPVQFAPNLTLPGGFKMDSFDNVNCDVKTATGNTNSTKNILEQKKARRVFKIVPKIYRVFIKDLQI